MTRIRARLLLLAATLVLWLPAGAQLHRGARTIVRGGLLEKPDSLRPKRDSAELARIILHYDSVATAGYLADSAAVSALRTDDRRYLDSLALARFEVARLGIDTTPKTRVFKKGWLMSDSMSLSKVCWISTVVPGYGQIYNKQYWKLPILYGLVGTGLGLYIHENKTYKPLKRQFESYTDVNLSRTPELGRPPVQDDPQQHAASGLPGDHDRLVHLLHRRRGRELLDQRRVERQEGHHAGLHLPRRGTDLQQKLLESALRRGRFRRDDLLYRLEQPRLPAFQKGLQSVERLRPQSRQIPPTDRPTSSTDAIRPRSSATCATTTGATATSASSSRARCMSCRSSMPMSMPT